MIIDGAIVTNPQSPAPIGLILAGATHWITVADAAALARALRQVAETVHGAQPAPAHEPDPAAYGAVLTALRRLIAADNANYARDTMRYEGLFDAGRQAIWDATGEDLRHADDSPVWTPADSAPALRDMLSFMLRTVDDTLRHGLTAGQRASLEDMTRRARLLLAATPSNE